MKAPVSHLQDLLMQAAPAALLRAAEKARRLAEQTGTPFISHISEPGEANAKTVPPADSHEEKDAGNK